MNDRPLVNIAGAVPNYKLVCEPYSKFLTSKVDYCQSRERLGSWLSFNDELLYIIECGPLPRYVHLKSIRHL